MFSIAGAAVLQEGSKTKQGFNRSNTVRCDEQQKYLSFEEKRNEEKDIKKEDFYQNVLTSDLLFSSRQYGLEQ